VPSDHPPTSAGRYELLEEIARGGMGVIYRAADTALGREVVVKVLQGKFAPDSGTSRRFAAEARITAQLQHPAIPPVHDCGTLPDGRPFLAMKLIKGRTLEMLLRERSDSAADRGRFLAIFEQVCQAVAYAHAHRVLHRDLKPANVMVGGFGEVQVMDWGLAKVLTEAAAPPTTGDPGATTIPGTLIRGSDADGSDGLYTQAGSILGTLAYMPPEQAAGDVGHLDERVDVFGLGAILAVLLTGLPPYAGADTEAVRVMAIRGDLAACLARLDGCGAEPELMALCKRCLAFAPAERPRDAGAVAEEVAGLRAAADERARRAELDKVRIEGEKAAAEARTLERRKRRQLWLGAAAAFVVAALGGLGTVLAVQRQANTDLAVKNAELADEQAKVQARFELAQRAIATFHTGVSEDMLLKNVELKELRTKLLKEAATFYSDLEKLLAGQPDAKSRQTLAEGYFQLAELTDKIGDKKEALEIHRLALALRRELAAAEGADVKTRLDVACSLHAVGALLFSTSDPAKALSAYQEERDLAAALEAESPTDAVRAQLAFGHNGIGFVLEDMGKPAEALDAYRKALAIYQKLPEAGQYLVPGQGPTFGLQAQAGAYNSIGHLLCNRGEVAHGLEALREASDIMDKLGQGQPCQHLCPVVSGQLPGRCR
jgi:tetratricopeptide (TPR) repeat protein